MKGDKLQKSSRLKDALGWLPLVAAIISTILFGLYSWSLAIEVVTLGSVTQTRFQHFLAGTPNSMGDTLAGFMGSLTLIWVVASVIQQSMELRAQRAEFREMVKAQDAQVQSLEAQRAIFLDEKLMRDQQRSSDLLSEKMENLRVKIIKIANISWFGATRPGEGQESRQLILGSSGAEIASLNVERLISSATRGLTTLYRELVDWKVSGMNRMPSIELVEPIIDIISQIEVIRENLSDASREKLMRFELDGLKNILIRYREAGLWS